MLKQACYALCFLAFAGCAQPTQASSHPNATLADPQTERDLVVKPGKFAELNLNVVNPTTIEVAYLSDAPLAWNVHAHQHGKTVYHQRGDARRGTLRHVASTPGRVSFMWENKGSQSIRLQIAFTPSPRFEGVSWHPAAP